MPRVLQKLAVIALLTLTVMLLIFKPSFNFSFRPPPEPTHQSGLRWFHPKGFPSVDEWEDRLRGQKIFLGPSYILQVPNPSAPDLGFPEETRIIFPGSVCTVDWVEERLNMRVDWDGTVEEVYYG